MNRIWELKQSAESPDVLEMYIYGNVEGNGYDWWSGKEIESETSADHFKNELAKYTDIKNINLYVNSYGGSVFEAMSIRNQLKRHSAIVTAYVDGFACSAASFILTGCDKVVMYSNTMQMIHNAWNCVMGNAAELRKAADDLDNIMEGNMQAYLEKTGDKMTKDKLKELLDAESWLTAQQCLEYGLADEVLVDTADMTEAKQLLQKQNDNLVAKVNYNKSIAAQLREMAKDDKPEPKNPDPEPAAPEQLTNAEKLKQIFNKKTEVI